MAADAVLACAAIDGITLHGQLPAPGHDELLFWSRRSGLPASVLRRGAPRQAHNRHRGKYATGDVGEWKSFYFRGPEKTLNVRARNLSEFLRIAAEIDDGIWEYHLRAGDYEAWFRHVIRDDALADEARDVMLKPNLPVAESRRLVTNAIERRYVLDHVVA